MPIETAADRAVFFDTGDFAVTATYTVLGGSSVSVAGLFDNAVIEIGRTDGPGMSEREGVFTCRSADLPAGADDGDTLALDGTNYLVREVNHDGMGVTELALEYSGPTAPPDPPELVYSDPENSQYLLLLII